MKIADKLLHYILFCMLFLAIFFVYHGTRETFIPHGLYPKSVVSPLLSGTYPLKQPGGLSKYTYETQSELYPKWTVGNYEQKTNNVKFWKTPCNGTASPADTCGGLYDAVAVAPDCTPPAPKHYCRRVNYFCA